MGKRKIETAYFSEKGERPDNQDAVFAQALGENAILCVSDGMGGHSSGDLASAAVVEAVGECWEYLKKKGTEVSREHMEQMCADALCRVNLELYRRFAAHGEICGATAVVMLIMSGRYWVCSVGDSHIYRLEDRSLVPMTEDDIWENLPEIRAKGYSEEELALDGRAGKLTAAVGPGEDMELHTYRGEVNTGDLFLLCTDGVYRFCDSKKLSGIVASKHLFGGIGAMAARISRCAKKSRTTDNYSAVVCRIVNG